MPDAVRKIAAAVAAGSGAAATWAVAQAVGADHPAVVLLGGLFLALVLLVAAGPTE